MGEVHLTLLDVGQGLSVVIETANHSLLFDAGARFSDKFDMGRNVVLPYLHFRDITALDKFIISHADNDHIGGAEAVLSEIPVRQVVSSVPGQLSAYNAVMCNTGFSWQWDQVHFAILSPPAELFHDENNNSCVLKVATNNGSVLLTGDIERAAEGYLIHNAGKSLQADILIAPHHGSKTSSSAAFLAKVNPEIILVPADSPNRFGFPHADVVNRYKAIAARYFISGETGAISVTMTKNQIQLESYREKHSRYWNK